jgi:EH domain-containing protein 1
LLLRSCILNKADQVDRQQLLRVYGELMWSLGKVVKTPEVLRVYVGSFWNEPLRYEDNSELFQLEQKDLMNDLKMLPRNSAVRKINELVKRIRIAKVHAFLIAHLKEQMPMMMGHAKKQKQLIDDLPKQFRSVMKKYNLAPGDFPEIDDYKSKLAEMEFSKFHSLKLRLLEEVEVALTIDIPRLLEALPRITTAHTEEAVPTGPLVYENTLARSTGANGNSSWAAGADDDSNPFGDDDWALAEYVDSYRPAFNSSQSNGFVSGAAAKNILLQSGIPKANLKKIWDLSDIDKDGQLSLNEFVIAMYLTDLCKQGQPLPAQLEAHMIPPN